MLHTPTNKLLLTLDKLYTDEIILSGGLKLYLDPSFRPEWNVTVTGTVAALPREGIPGLSIGAKVHFSYLVVYQRKWEDDKKFFVRNVLGNEMVKEWTDKMGGTIKVVAFQGKGFEKKWGATYVNEYGDFVAGCQGKESDIDRWMAANFKFGYSQDMKYKNLLEIDGEDYWMAHKDDIFATVVDGKLQATPGNAICKPVRIDIGRRIAIENGLRIPSKDVILVPQDRGILVSMGAQAELKVTAKEGQTVLFPTNLIEKYSFDGENYFVVKHRRLLAVV
jgi:co-chaperonin GroES (HSP10)